MWTQGPIRQLQDRLNHALFHAEKPMMTDEYFGRDTFIKHWVHHALPLMTINYPLPWLRYKPIMTEVPDFPTEDAHEWGHNRQLIDLFIDTLQETSDGVYLFSDTFSNGDAERSYHVPLHEWHAFCDETGLPFNFIGDILLFSDDFQQIVILFHHKHVHFASIANEPTTLIQRIKRRQGSS